MLSLKNIERLFLFAAIDAFKDRNMPEWIKDHPALQKKVKKVFPSFGIKNFRDKVKLDQSFNTRDLGFARDANYKLFSVIYNEIENLSNRVNAKLIKNINPYNEHGIHQGEMGDAQKAELQREEFIKEYSQYFKLINTEWSGSLNNSVIVQPDGRVKLISSEELTLGSRKIGRKGEPIFRIYMKLKTLIEELGKKYDTRVSIPELDSIPEIKEFNKKNIPLAGNQMYVVFTSEGEGAWDLATMSMRGIESCQSWEGGHNYCLIGSIASKYVGIIYLTNTQSYEHPELRRSTGEKMIRRCIVRFGVNIKTKKPVIILDKMYDSYNKEVAEVFLKALQTKTELQILNFAGRSGDSDYQRNSNRDDIQTPVEKIKHLNEGYRGGESYRDTHFEEMKPSEKFKPKTNAFIDNSKYLINLTNLIHDAIFRKISTMRDLYDYDRYDDTIVSYVKAVAFNGLANQGEISTFLHKHNVTNKKMTILFTLQQVLKKINNQEELFNEFLSYYNDHSRQYKDHDKKRQEQITTLIQEYTKELNKSIKTIIQKVKTKSNAEFTDEPGIDLGE